MRDHDGLDELITMAEMRKLGLDHTRMTYRFNGRDMRLTDVYSTLIPQIVAAC